MHNFAAGKDATDVPEPALQYFDVNSECQHIESAEFDPLPPMRRCAGVQIITGETLQQHMMRAADVIFCQEFFD